VDSIFDVTPGPTRSFFIKEWNAHALVCDAGNPHIVTFSGANRKPGAGRHLLWQVADCGEKKGAVSVFAEMDHQNRLLSLKVISALSPCTTDTSVDTEVVLLDATWDRSAVETIFTGAVNTYVAPHAALRVIHQDLEQEATTTFVEETTTATETTKPFDYVFNIFGDRGVGVVDTDSAQNECDKLLVRLQANGTASFAVKCDDMLVFPDAVNKNETGLRAHAHGILLERDCNDDLSSLANVGTVVSLYEQHVEPHLNIAAPAFRKVHSLENQVFNGSGVRVVVDDTK
jgi:hypothetical protein